MIYLTPIGGLCNRMRTMDSLFSLCKIHRKELTVIWVRNSALNCAFGELFEIPEFDEFNFKVIDVPIGYPELFVKNPNLFRPVYNGPSSHDNHLVRKVKNGLKGRFLTGESRKIKGILECLKENNIVTDKELGTLYASEKYGVDTTISEMDANFIPHAKRIIEPLLTKNGRDVYISSCYRLHLLENAYTSFIPTAKILSKVEGTAELFDNTVGLHIRRSDHKVSKEISTTEKFIDIVKSSLKENPDTTFFLSTDDSDTKGELLNRFGRKIYVNEISSYNRNDANAVKDAMVDLYCLSRTKKIYGSHHSSFSQTAADIGSIQEITAK